MVRARGGEAEGAGLLRGVIVAQTDYQALLLSARERLQTASDALPTLIQQVAKCQAHFDWRTSGRPNLPGLPEYRQHDEATQGAPKNLLREAKAALEAKQADVRTWQEQIARIEWLIAHEQAAAAAAKE